MDAGQEATSAVPSSPDTDLQPDASSVDLGHLPGLVGYALRRAQVAAFRTFSRRFAAFDIRPSQLGILTVVARNPGLRPSEVGAALGIQRTNLVPLLNGLADRGLLARERRATDRRAHALRLTENGKTLLAALMRAEAEHEADITAALGPGESERLVALLDAVQRRCDAIGAASDEPEDP